MVAAAVAERGEERDEGAHEKLNMCPPGVPSLSLCLRYDGVLPVRRDEHAVLVVYAYTIRTSKPLGITLELELDCPCGRIHALSTFLSKQNGRAIHHRDWIVLINAFTALSCQVVFIENLSTKCCRCYMEWRDCASSG